MTLLNLSIEIKKQLFTKNMVKTKLVANILKLKIGFKPKFGIKNITRFNVNIMMCLILISNFNKSKYVKRCLESLISQTYKNLEIIFSDNNSSDNSLNRIQVQSC